MSKVLAAYDMPPRRAGQKSEVGIIAQHPEVICENIGRIVV